MSSSSSSGHAEGPQSITWDELEQMLRRIVAEALEGLRMPDVMTVDEAAAALRVSPAMVRRWIRVGEIVPLDLSGDRRLSPKEQILTLIAEAGKKRRKCGAAP